MLKQRAIVTSAGTVFAFALTILAPIDAFIVVVCAIAFLAFNEFLRMYRVHSDPGLYGASLTLFLLLGLTLLLPTLRTPWLSLPLISLVMLSAGLIKQQIEPRDFERIAVIIVGIMYVGSLIYFMTLIRLLPNGKEYILVLGLGTGVRDVGAFIWGYFFPRGHSMLFNVSKRKTLEGALAALVLTAVIVVVSGMWLLKHWSVVELIVLGVLIGVFGQVGDLVESWLKRTSASTDSSHIFRGQGGVLDAVDGFMFTAPVMYLYIHILVGTGT
jgi:phosphatidate cytidylyltransferase